MSQPKYEPIRVPHSESPDCVWPAIPSIGASRMLATQHQLAQTERWAPDVLKHMQFTQLANVIRHAVETVPHYRHLLAGAAPACADELALAWQDLPLLARAEVQAAGDGLLSRKIPPGHDNLHRIETSGSTGTPVGAYGTDITRYYWYAFTLREHLWHARDFESTLLSIRPEVDLEANAVQRAEGWGPATDSIYPTGPMVVMNSRSDIATQVRILAEANPAYLLSMPSNCLALIAHCESEGITLPGLREVRTFAEALNPRLRDRAASVWGVPVVDTYSAQEVGNIAVQCPENAHYHIQSENLLVEVLNGEGTACAPGEIGRVVVTTLHNFAMPLIRYAIGDYAEVGAGTCNCGRRLPVLSRVLGRVRNMLTRPDGSKLWPSFPSELWLDRYPIRQLQLVQTAVDSIEVRAVVSRPLSGDEERTFSGMLSSRFGYAFKVAYAYRDQLERSASGKFEDFISHV